MCSSNLGAPAAVRLKAPGNVSLAPPARETRTEYVPAGTAGRLNVAVICVGKSTEKLEGAKVVVPSEATSATVVVASKPAPVSVSVAGAPLPEWLGVRPV